MSKRTSLSAPREEEIAKPKAKAAPKKKTPAKKASPRKGVAGAAKTVKEKTPKSAGKPANPATAAKKTVPARKKATRKSAKVVPDAGEIALRAYYIAEKRRAAGQPGNERDDWFEAERQLLAEAAAK